MSYGRIKIDKADQVFSLFIRERDNWQCQNPKCGRIYLPHERGLQNSHFWSRGNENTRFDPLNCDALCFHCHHRWGGDYRKEYEAFKIKQLGKREFDLLMLRAHQYKKKDRAMSLIIVSQMLDKLRSGSIPHSPTNFKGQDWGERGR